MSTRNAVCRRWSVALGVVALCFASVAQANSMHAVTRQAAAPAWLTATASTVVLPATWEPGVVESLSLAVLGALLIGAAVALRRLTRAAPPDRPDLPLAPLAAVQIRRRTIQLKPAGSAHVFQRSA